MCRLPPCADAALGVSEADRQGYAIDKKFLLDTVEDTLGSPEKMIASKLINDPAAPPDPRPSGKGVSMGTVFMAVAARSLPVLGKGQRQSLNLIADDIVKKQRDDRSWEFFSNLRRPPINECQTTDAVSDHSGIAGRNRVRRFGG